ncbi:MAG: PAS domain S-box protein [Bacteroidia bacterium]
MKPKFDIKIIASFIIISLLLFFATLLSIKSNKRNYVISVQLQNTNLMMKNIEDALFQSLEIFSSYDEYAKGQDKYFLESFRNSQNQLRETQKKLLASANENPLFSKEVNNIISHTQYLTTIPEPVAKTENKKQSKRGELIYSRIDLETTISGLIRDVENIGREHLRELEREQQQLAINATIINYLLAGLSFFIIGGIFILLQQEFNKSKKATKEINYLTSFINEKELSETMINSLPGIFYLNDIEGKMLRWNKNFETVTGYTSDELKTMRARDFFDSQDLQLVLKMKEVAFNEGATDFEAGFVIKDGRKISYYFTGRRLLYEQAIAILGVGIDITNLKKAEEQIITEKELSDSIINSLPGVFYLYDESRNFLRWNKNFETVSGYSHEEISKMHPLDFFEGKNKNIVEEKIAGVFENGAAAEVEVEVVTKDKVNIPYYFNGQIVNYENKRCLIGVGIDITARKKAEEEIIKTNKRFETISKVTNDALWEWNFVTGELWGNETHQKLYGLSMADPVPTEIDWKTRIHPNDRDKIIDMQARSLASDKSVFITEYRFLDPGNEYRNIYDRCYIIRDNTGIATSMIGSMMDITEQKETERELAKSFSMLEATLESTADGILVADYNGNIIRFNKKFAALWRIPSAILATGDDDKALEFVLDQLISPESFLSKVKELYAQQEAVSFDILEFKDGRTFERYSQPQLINGKYIGRVWSFRDITVRKKAEEEIKKSQLDLRQLTAHLQTIREEERTRIAREVHDELGQQLTGLKMDVSWINKKIPPDEKIVHEKIDGMITLIDETVKTVRRISSELRPGILDDLGLIAALEWQSSEFEKRTGISCKFNSEISELDIEKDMTTGIFRVYQETLTNVARHANATQVEAQIENDNGLIILTVKDNGQGFEMDEAKSKNTLGLIGMKERTKMFGGEINIQSEKGKGTVITIKVPILAPAKELI